MKSISSQELREIFLRFFEEKNHLRISGASLIPANDPTLLFVNSGMAPLKKYFIGEDTPPQPDLCNIQPCIRTRDIDDVGDRHHLTFFEMLGSWSINNYFKERAIELAYELLVERFGFPSEKLYASVYRGNPEINLPPDNVSARVWEKVGLKSSQIVFLGEDNFWGPAGDHGPCGPCTEVFFDTGAEFGEAYEEAGHFDTQKRYIEIWNAGVFMELNKLPDGRFEKLRFTSVDTGSGVERMTMTMNRFSSVYETDPLRPILDDIASQLTDKRSSVRDYRILADHLRASTFILGEGVSPSNEGRGYIPRRLIRKSIALVTRAGASRFDFAGIISGIIDRSAMNYPVLAKNKQHVIDAFMKERVDFERVIGKGLERLNNFSEEPPFVLSGADAFSLSSTYGMPLELIRDFVRDRGGELDEEGFHREFRKHQEISRAVGLSEKSLGKPAKWPAVDERFDVLSSLGRKTEFLGYQELKRTGQVLALFRDGVSVEEVLSGEHAEVVLDRTPFYAEGGGQVGDKGELRKEVEFHADVEDCIKVAGGYHVHRAVVIAGRLRVGDLVEGAVDAEHRERVKANHSATHLLHSVLRTVLGDQVKQSGSLVEASRFRFDFQHPGKLTPEQLLDIERLVNRYIRANVPAQTVISSYDEAVRRGALAFFGDKYGEEVRTVQFGDVSMELCGGTHVSATGDIALFRIVSESSIASGVRRLVVVTGEAAVEYTLHREQLLKDILSSLRVSPDDAMERISSLLTRPSKTANDVSGATAKVQPSLEPKSLSDGTSYVSGELFLDVSELREEALRIAHATDGLALLVAKQDDKVRVILAVSKKKTETFDANSILRELLPLIHGKGGGKKDLAQGGSDSVSGIDDLLAELPSVLERQIVETVSQ